MFDNEYVLDIWRFQWLFGMGILVYKMQKVDFYRNKQQKFLVVLNLFTLICLGSPLYWPRSLPLLCSNFLLKPTTLYIWLFSWDSQAVQQWQCWGAHTEEPHPWDRLDLFHVHVCMRHLAQVSKGLCPGEVSPPLSSFTLSELPWWDPGYYRLLENDLGGQGKKG